MSQRLSGGWWTHRVVCAAEPAVNSDCHLGPTAPHYSDEQQLRVQASRPSVSLLLGERSRSSSQTTGTSRQETLFWELNRTYWSIGTDSRPSPDLPLWSSINQFTVELQTFPHPVCSFLSVTDCWSSWTQTQRTVMTAADSHGWTYVTRSFCFISHLHPSDSFSHVFLSDHCDVCDELQDGDLFLPSSAQ